jgi:hypothetical protein
VPAQQEALAPREHHLPERGDLLGAPQGRPPLDRATLDAQRPSLPSRLWDAGQDLPDALHPWNHQIAPKLSRLCDLLSTAGRRFAWEPAGPAGSDLTFGTLAFTINQESAFAWTSASGYMFCAPKPWHIFLGHPANRGMTA